MGNAENILQYYKLIYTEQNRTVIVLDVYILYYIVLHMNMHTLS